jgi:hypothetical protein
MRRRQASAISSSQGASTLATAARGRRELEFVGNIGRKPSTSERDLGDFALPVSNLEGLIVESVGSKINKITEW